MRVPSEPRRAREAGARVARRLPFVVGGMG